MILPPGGDMYNKFIDEQLRKGNIFNDFNSRMEAASTITYDANTQLAAFVESTVEHLKPYTRKPLPVKWTFAMNGKYDGKLIYVRMPRDDGGKEQMTVLQFINGNPRLGWRGFLKEVHHKLIPGAAQASCASYPQLALYSRVLHYDGEYAERVSSLMQRPAVLLMSKKAVQIACLLQAIDAGKKTVRDLHELLTTMERELGPRVDPIEPADEVIRLQRQQQRLKSDVQRLRGREEDAVELVQSTRKQLREQKEAGDAELETATQARQRLESDVQRLKRKLEDEAREQKRLREELDHLKTTTKAYLLVLPAGDLFLTENVLGEVSLPIGEEVEAIQLTPRDEEVAGGEEQYFTVGRGGGCLRARLACFEEHGKDLTLALRSGRKVVLRVPQGIAGEQGMSKVAVYNKAL